MMASWEIAAALLKPLAGRELQVTRESINAQPGGLGPQRCQCNGRAGGGSSKLVRRSGTSNSPWCCSVPRCETTTGLALRQAIPNFSYVRLNDLRLQLRPRSCWWLLHPWPPSDGPDCSPQRPNRQNPSRPGVVRLLSGRLSFFHQFQPSIPTRRTVAVFTPSPGAGALPGHRLCAPAISEHLDHWQSDAARSRISRCVVNFTPLDQLNLVSRPCSGERPADRIGESVRSCAATTPISEQRLWP